MTEKRVYLDYAATAPLLPAVREAMCAYAATDFGNASALYKEGKRAQQALEQARRHLSECLGTAPQELTFCSGGTEACGTLLEGIAQGAAERAGSWQNRKHIVCSAFEHPAMLKSALALKRLGYEVELLRPTREGRISPEKLEAALREDTLLVSVMLAQNELGTVQEVAELAQRTHQAGALFVCDGVQAFGKLSIDLAELSIDAACFSAHKLGGPVGTGAFYLKSSTPFLPRQLGGGQENKLRSGTQDVAGALGFALAAQLHTPLFIAEEGKRLATLRDTLLQCLTEGSERIRATVTVAPEDISGHLPGYLSVLVQGIESQTMVLKLDELGFAVSGGSACSTGSLDPSHVLTALGVSKDEAFGALRITMGRDTREEDCARFAEALLSLLK